jgi:hypothetical protein
MREDKLPVIGWCMLREGIKGRFSRYDADRFGEVEQRSPSDPEAHVDSYRATGCGSR